MIDVRPVAGDDWTVVAWLWQAFRNDLAAISGSLPGPDGRYRHDWVDGWPESDDVAGYVVWRGDSPVAFAVVNRLREGPRGLAGFFVAPAARRGGLGRRFALDVLDRHPGPWAIAFQRDNHSGGEFWRRVAAEAFGDGWREEPRAVPGRPEDPPDHWIVT